MNTDASIQVESVTVDFPIYNANMRSIKNQFIYHGTGGRVGRHAGNRLTVRALDDVSPQPRARRPGRHHRPQRRGQDDVTAGHGGRVRTGKGPH